MITTYLVVEIIIINCCDLGYFHFYFHQPTTRPVLVFSLNQSPDQNGGHLFILKWLCDFSLLFITDSIIVSLFTNLVFSMYNLNILSITLL